MKSWKLFYYATAKMKLDKNGEPIKCVKNDILFMVMNLSGITPDDVDELLHQ